MDRSRSPGFRINVSHGHPHPKHTLVSTGSTMSRSFAASSRERCPVLVRPRLCLRLVALECPSLHSIIPLPPTPTPLPNHRNAPSVPLRDFSQRAMFRAASACNVRRHIGEVVQNTGDPPGGYKQRPAVPYASGSRIRIAGPSRRAG